MCEVVNDIGYRIQVFIIEITSMYVKGWLIYHLIWIGLQFDYNKKAFMLLNFDKLY